MSSKEEKDEKKMEKVEEEIVSKEEAGKMKELRRRVEGLAEDNEYVKSNLTDQAIVRCILHTHITSLSKHKLYNNDTVEISCSTELGYEQIGKNVYGVHEVEEGDRYETCDRHVRERRIRRRGGGTRGETRS